MDWQSSEVERRSSGLNTSIKEDPQDFPDGPVVMTPSFHCRGHGFDPWLGKFHVPQGGFSLNHKVLFGKDKCARNDLDQHWVDMLTEVI